MIEILGRYRNDRFKVWVVGKYDPELIDLITTKVGLGTMGQPVMQWLASDGLTSSHEHLLAQVNLPNCVFTGSRSSKRASFTGYLTMQWVDLKPGGAVRLQWR